MMKEISKKIILIFIAINFILCQYVSVKAENSTPEEHYTYRETLKSIYLSNIKELDYMTYDIEKNGIEELR